MNLATILDDCLHRLQAGETIAGCLARYPDQAVDLAPMLAAAEQFASLAGRQPTDAQRQRALARLRQEAALQRVNQSSPARASRLAPLFAVRRLAAAAAVVLLLLVSLSAGVVASSQPGQPAYELRVIVERATVLSAFNASDRAAAELSVADRRLTDLQTHLAQAGQIEPAALRALLAGDRAAAHQALAAGQSERVQIIQRLTARARLLDELAGAAVDPSAAASLAVAADNTWRLVEGLRTSLSEPPALAPPVRDDVLEASATSTSTVPPTPTPSATASPIASLTATATPSPAAQETPTTTWTATPTANATSAPQAAPSAQATQPPRPRLTAVAQTATALAQTPPAGQTPRPRLTALAQTATALAQTPRPTRPPRPRLTATALAQTATAQAQTPTPQPGGTPTPGQPQPTETAPGQPTGGPQPSPGPGMPQVRPRPGTQP